MTTLYQGRGRRRVDSLLVLLLLIAAIGNVISFVHINFHGELPCTGSSRQKQTVSSSKICSSERTTRLALSSSSSSSSSSISSSIRFLGRGPDAIVRPGVVLVAPAEEYHHFLRRAAVFIYAMGTDGNDKYIIRGVIIDHPTAFTMGEMMESKTGGGVYENLIYRGGDTGGESAFCLHSLHYIGREEIGSSKIYQGGDPNQMDDPSKVKFFFNYMEFTENELEDMLKIFHEDGDAWTSLEVPPEIVLDSEYDRGDAWSRLRNVIRDKEHNFD